MRSTQWLDDALCAEIGPNDELWFPIPQSGLVGEAKKICGGCPAQIACLSDALNDPAIDDHGVRGGTTPKERRELRKKIAA